MDRKRREISRWMMLGIFAIWILLTEFTPHLNRVVDLNRINHNIWPAVQMTLMLLVTYAFVRYYEKEEFLPGFHLSLERVGASLLWAFVFFCVALAVEAAFQFLIFMPLAERIIVPSGEASPEAVASLPSRLIEYLYVFYEGIVEVLIFIGFLFDRLARRWNWKAALVVSNVGFALWHYNYWNQGALVGTVMVIMVFLVGSIITLSYQKTRNTVSPLICHTLVDLPSELRHLLGGM